MDVERERLRGTGRDPAPAVGGRANGRPLPVAAGSAGERPVAQPVEQPGPDLDEAEREEPA